MILAYTLFSIFIAFCPNLSEDNDCSIWLLEGVMHITTHVRLFPPRDDLRILVKGEFR